MGQYALIASISLFLTSLTFFTFAGGSTIFDFQGDQGQFEDPPSVSSDGYISQAFEYAKHLVGLFTSGDSGYTAFNFIIGGTLAVLGIMLLVAVIRGLS